MAPVFVRFQDTARPAMQPPVKPPRSEVRMRGLPDAIGRPSSACATRAPTTTAGMFVFARGIVGISAQSATHSCSSPCTRPAASQTACGSSARPMRAVPTGW